MVPQAETLQALLGRTHIQTWDILIIGDGSGTGWEDYCGWASILIDRATGGRKTCYGGMNIGSINVAEMMPYFQALMWFHHTYGMDRLKQRSPQRVHIITDSQVTALHGNRAAGRHEDLPKLGQRPIWAALREYTALGYSVQWHWADRCDSGLNYLADLIAGLSRRSIKNMDETPVELAERARLAVEKLQFKDPETGEHISPYLINPNEDTHATGSPTHSDSAG